MRVPRAAGPPLATALSHALVAVPIGPAAAVVDIALVAIEAIAPRLGTMTAIPGKRNAWISDRIANP